MNEFLKRLSVAFRRFFARIIDTILFGLPVAGVTALIHVLYFPEILINHGVIAAVQMINLPIILFLEYLVYKLAGTTPGKALLFLEVRTKEGHVATPGEYGKRLRALYTKGFYFGLPGVSNAKMLYNFVLFLRHGETEYDQEQFVVVAERMSILGVISALSIVLFVVFLLWLFVSLPR